MRLFPRRRRKLNVAEFTENWRSLQKLCSTRKTWPQALAQADALLDQALKQKRFKGKTLGERLVAAQRELTSNDAVWFSHKFCGKIADLDVRKLKKDDVVSALAGIRQALRDLGALET